MGRPGSRYDAIVVGAGHNGLVAACYLARAGLRVLVLERREVVGGACVTEEVFPGFKVSTAAYVLSLFRPEIVRELRLADHGFEVLARDPSSFTPLPDGRSLLLGRDPARNRRAIAAFDARDAERYPAYEAMLARVASAVEPMLAMTPPDVLRPGPRDLWRFWALGRAFRRLGSHAGEAVELLAGAACPLLERWFRGDALKATLATDAVIGAMASPSTPGTGYLLLHHVMGESAGARGAWGYVRGGMGGLTAALAAAARAAGAEVRCGAEVARIVVQGGRVAGVVLTGGDEIGAETVASSADARATFTRLVDPRALPAEFVAAVDRIDYTSASLKINVALTELPSFTACPGTAPAPHHRGTIHLCPDLDYMERAYDDAKYGRPSTAPIIELTLPSVVDPTVAPPGLHLASLFVQYAPYALREGGWDTLRDTFADRCFDVVNAYAPNFTRSVAARQVLTPLDLERVFGLSGGNIFQGAMAPHQLFSFRPVPGYSGYRTPIQGLWLCGAAAHPGGGVTGAPGRNAAREILGPRRFRTARRG